MKYTQQLEIVTEIIRRFRYYKSMEALFELDQWSGLPEEGTVYRQQMAAFVTEQKTGLFLSPEAKSVADYFSCIPLTEIEDYVDRGLIRKFLLNYQHAVRTPKDKQQEYSLIKAECMLHWKEAREERDYTVFMPWLKKAFELKRAIAIAVNPDVPAFDTLVGLTDEGLCIKDVSEQFEILKSGIGCLLQKIQQKTAKTYPVLPEMDENPLQLASFSQRLAREVGYLASRGSFNDKVVHGFTSFLGPRDARVSTHQSNSLKLIFTYLHEAGHAMYSSSSNQQVINANMWGGIEGGFHEANARFYENMIGRSRAYWEFYYPQLQAEFPHFMDISLEDFYQTLHVVQPSLQRIASDEVTYSLHAIMRFELERDYFSGDLKAEDMDQAWNEKYEKYLGIRPQNDLEGILQDMHWAGDYIGYFQSYTLGNIYDGQILEAVQSDLPDIYSSIKEGRFEPLNAWMEKNVWQYGCCFTGSELIQKISGKSLDARPFLNYLNEKYARIYGF